LAEFLKYADEANTEAGSKGLPELPANP